MRYSKGFYSVITQIVLFLAFTPMSVTWASLHTKKDPIKILSIDGGGARGIIPACFLKAFEEQTGKSVVECFDIFAGTSIGGMLSLFLTHPDYSKTRPLYSAADAVKLFDTRAPEIFSQDWNWYLSTGGGLYGPKYNHDRFEKMLQEKFTPKALFSSCLKPTLVTSYELERDKPFVFNSITAQEKPKLNFKTWQVARATSAAPTYFSPASFPSEDGTVYSFVDGGVVANNPSMEAYAEARRRYGPDREIILVSLGTGSTLNTVDHNQAASWGPLGWLKPVLNMTISGVSSLVDEQMRSLLDADERGHYIRLNPTLKHAEGDMDNISHKNFKKLKIRAEKCIEENMDRIEAIAYKILPSNEKEIAEIAWDD